MVIILSIELYFTLMLVKYVIILYHLSNSVILQSFEIMYALIILTEMISIEPTYKFVALEV